MSGFYDEMAKVARELLREFGRPVTISRTIGGSVGPVTGVITTGATTTLTPSGILKPYKDSMIDGTRILASDRLLILDASVEPLPTDKPVIDGKPWSIQAINASSPAGTPLCYFVQVRR